VQLIDLLIETACYELSPLDFLLLISEPNDLALDHLFQGKGSESPWIAQPYREIKQVDLLIQASCFFLDFVKDKKGYLFQSVFLITHNDLTQGSSQCTS
jgi:hypothetical protein